MFFFGEQRKGSKTLIDSLVQRLSQFDLEKTEVEPEALAQAFIALDMIGADPKLVSKFYGVIQTNLPHFTQEDLLLID